jgi:hypothetical protein
MDIAALATALIGAQAAQTQSTIAMTMLKMSAKADASVLQLLEPASQGASQLANVASGVGGNLDISA